MKKHIRITESDLNRLVKKILNEGLPPSMMKLFGAQTARKLEQTFEPEVAENIEKYFAYIIADSEKNLLTKAGQQYLKSSIGVEIPTTTIKSILDMGLSGKINKSNMEQYLGYLPEKLSNGSEFRNNIRKLLTATINKVEKTGAQKAAGQAEVKATTPVSQTSATQKVATNQSSQVAPVGQSLSKGSFQMADPEESSKLAQWFDQKFYEAGDKRHDEITNAQFEKMLPETKDYLKKLYERMKEILPDNPNSRIIPKTERDVIDAVTNNYWGGYGRYGKLVRMKIDGQSVPSLPIPTKSIEDNLNSIFPTPPNSSLNYGKTAWTSSK